MRRDPSCAACERDHLVAHMRVGGEMGTNGLIPTTDRFGTALADIVRCPNCGHMQLDPMPDDGVLSAAYAEAQSDDYIEEEAGQRETARRTIALLERHCRRPGRMVDLGCWVGFLLAEARERGWEVVGVEPSAFAASYARERLGIDVIQADMFAAPLPDGAFDAVMMGDVIEHLGDPGEALERVRRLLAPDGVLWLALPDAGSRVARALGSRWWSVIPTHVQYFTRTSLRTLLARHGFDVQEIVTAPKAFTVGYYLGRVGGYSPAAGRALVSAAEHAGIANKMWAPDFRDRMSVVALVRGS